MNAWVFRNKVSGLLTGVAVLLPEGKIPECPVGCVAELGVLPATALVNQVQAQSSFIRFHRSNLLTASDWTQLIDAPLTSQQKILWSAYRQALRQITEQSGFPGATLWPVPP